MCVNFHRCPAYWDYLCPTDSAATVASVPTQEMRSASLISRHSQRSNPNNQSVARFFPAALDGDSFQLFEPWLGPTSKKCKKQPRQVGRPTRLFNRTESEY